MPERAFFEQEPKISLRPATEADTAFARETHHEAYHDVIVRQFGSFDEALQDKFFAEAWNPATHEMILDGGAPVGYRSVERLPNEIWLHELVLLPQVQGKGIGSRVLADVLEESRESGLPVRLVVLKENHARRLYTRLGFNDIGEDETHFEMIFEPSKT